MQLINNNLFKDLHQQAISSPRLRMNFNLHESLDSKAQRLLNALEPGTVLPIHRHQHTAETYILLEGSLNIVFYNDDKSLKRKILLSKDGNMGIHIPKGQWHTVEVLESSIIFEVKDGPYCPLNQDDIM